MNKRGSTSHKVIPQITEEEEEKEEKKDISMRRTSKYSAVLAKNDEMSVYFSIIQGKKRGQ
jgi:hypothetical protein